jgi:fatty acid desaturase
VFRNNANNTRVGNFLSWICGSAYITYENIRFKHFRHHVDNDDVVWFDYKAFFNRNPLVLKTVKVLEWFYIPAHDLLMHTIMIFNSFVIPANRNQRAENIKVILIRGGILVALVIWQPKVALLYALAYMLMMTVLRFMDGLQHKYPSYSLTLFSDEPSARKGDKEWEQAHTYSNPHVPWDSRLNWFTLNFGFHNAHHAQPTVPWYELPTLHQQLYDYPAEQSIPLKAQLRIFHKYRVARIMGVGELDNQPEAEAEWQAFLEAAKQGRVYGLNAVSFLTPF